MPAGEQSAADEGCGAEPAHLVPAQRGRDGAGADGARPCPFGCAGCGPRTCARLCVPERRCRGSPAALLRCLASLLPPPLATLQSLAASPSTDWSQAASQQHVLDAAEKGLPGPEALEQLRSMSLEQAVAFYNRWAPLCPAKTPPSAAGLNGAGGPAVPPQPTCRTRARAVHPAPRAPAPPHMPCCAELHWVTALLPLPPAPFPQPGGAGAGAAAARGRGAGCLTGQGAARSPFLS